MLPPNVDLDSPRTARVTRNTVQYTDERGRLVFAPPGEEINMLKHEEKHADYWNGLEPAGTDPADLEEGPTGELTPVNVETTDEEMVAWVTAAKVSEVEAYLRSNPQEYQRVLDAETTARGDKGPRPMVVKAAEVAAGHTAN